MLGSKVVWLKLFDLKIVWRFICFGYRHAKIYVMNKHLLLTRV